MINYSFVRDRALSIVGRVPKCCRTSGGVGEITRLAFIGLVRSIGSCKGQYQLSSRREQRDATYSRRRTCAKSAETPGCRRAQGSLQTKPISNNTIILPRQPVDRPSGGEIRPAPVAATELVCAVVGSRRRSVRTRRAAAASEC